MIELLGIAKHLGEVAVFEGFDLEVGRGERVAIVGESGTGKTTLLRLIAGLERPDAGTIRIGGVDAAALGPHERGLGYVPQSAGLFPSMDVRGNVAYGLHVLPRERREERLAWALAEFGLEPLATRAPHELSGGQARRVALARAMAPGPARLLLDEPLTNLDAAAREELLAAVDQAVTDARASLVYVTHDHAEATRLAARVVTLER